MTKHNIITGILLLIVGALFIAHLAQDREKEQRLIQTRNDVQFELEQTSTALRQSDSIRSVLLRSVDSLMDHTSALRAQLDKKNAEITRIKGRYDTVEADSLSKLMETRAWKRGN